MNILQIMIALIVLVVIFGLPIWNLARLRGNRHILWLIVPSVIPLLLLGVSMWIDISANEWLYRTMKALAFYWVIISGILFAFSIFGVLFETAFRISKKITFWIIISLTLIYGGYAHINGQRVVVKDINLPADHISREYQFVHITDLHSGSTDRMHAQKVVDTIAPLNPEFMVITGDFIDEEYVSTSDIDPFTQLDFPIFLITGNHEYYLNEGKIQEVIDGTNIMLIDDMRIAFQELDIIGVNERASVDSTLEVLGGINPERYSILLDHQPKTDEVIRASENGTQLMLSGHTHKGQIWPMNYLIQLGFKYVSGLYEIGEMFLYVNPGTGTLGPKMRVGSANEVTLITLEPTQ